MISPKSSGCYFLFDQDFSTHRGLILAVVRVVFEWILFGVFLVLILRVFVGLFIFDSDNRLALFSCFE